MMAQYPASVATLPAVTNRSKFTATLANTWLEEARALQADYASTVAGFSTLASYFAVSRDTVGGFKEAVSHDTLASVTASSHHNKLHATTHINGTDDIRNSVEVGVYQKGLMTPGQATKLDALSTSATADITGVGTYEGWGNYTSGKKKWSKKYLGRRPAFLRIIGVMGAAFVFAKSGRGLVETGRLHKMNPTYDLRITDEGFEVSGDLNLDGHQYSYFYIGESTGLDPTNYIWLDLQDQYYAAGANNTVHDVTTQDLGIAAWIKLDADSASAGMQTIVGKMVDNPQKGYFFGIYSPSGTLYFWIKEQPSGDQYELRATVDLRDGEWHHVAVVIDRNNGANCDLFVDGYRVPTNSKGLLSDVSSLTSTRIMRIGYSSYDGTDWYFDGQIREVIIAYPTDIMAAGEMGAPGEIANLANSYFEKEGYCQYEDYWACNDGSGTTITGDNNNLTLSNADAWFLR